jgi:HEAT repeat protein
VADTERIKNELINSHWPKCNALAEELFAIGTDEAKKALLEGLKSKRHHARTASIKSLVKFQDVSIVGYLEHMLQDPAYETRVEAQKAINILKYIQQ